MSWADSLIKLASYEVENRQARLAAVTRRREDAETRLAVLTAEGEAEEKHAASNAESGWYLAGYSEGLKVRKAAIQAEIDAIEAEERGARDALAEAFEEQKKYEQVAETMHAATVRQASRREGAELDEVGMRAVRRRAG